MAMASHSAPAVMPNAVGAMTLSKVSRHVAERGGKGSTSKGAASPADPSMNRAHRWSFMTPRPPKWKKGADDELNLAALP